MIPCSTACLSSTSAYAGALGAEIANRREARHERGAEVIGRARDAERRAPRAAPDRSSWSRCTDAAARASALRRARASTSCRADRSTVAPSTSPSIGRRDRRLDPIAADADRPAFVHRVPVEHARGAENEYGLRRGLLLNIQTQWKAKEGCESQAYDLGSAVLGSRVLGSGSRFSF